MPSPTKLFKAIAGFFENKAPDLYPASGLDFGQKIAGEIVGNVKARFALDNDFTLATARLKDGSEHTITFDKAFSLAPGDSFSGKVGLPVFDKSGELVAFGERRMDAAITVFDQNITRAGNKLAPYRRSPLEAATGQQATLRDLSATEKQNLAGLTQEQTEALALMRALNAPRVAAATTPQSEAIARALKQNGP